MRRLSIGLDLAFVHDGAAFVAVERHGDGASSWLEVVALDLRLPTPSNRLRPSALADEWMDRVVAMGGTHVSSDVHYLETLRESTLDRGLVLHNAPAGPTRLEAFIYLRHLTRSPRVELATAAAAGPCLPVMSALVYDSNRQAPASAAQSSLGGRRLALAPGLPFAAELREQMGQIRQTATAGGNISITAARTGSGHADLPFALVAAVALDRKLHGPIGLTLSAPRTHRGGWVSP